MNAKEFVRTLRPGFCPCTQRHLQVCPRIRLKWRGKTLMQDLQHVRAQKRSLKPRRQHTAKQNVEPYRISQPWVRQDAVGIRFESVDAQCVTLLLITSLSHCCIHEICNKVYTYVRSVIYFECQPNAKTSLQVRGPLLGVFQDAGIIRGQLESNSHTS